MTMTTEEFLKELKEISRKLDVRVSTDPKKPRASVIVYVIDQFHDRIIYNFTSQKYDEENCLKYIPEKLNDVNKLLNEYYKGRKEILARDSEAKKIGQTAKEFGNTLKEFNSKVASSNNDVNPFKKYTDKLAETLWEKNQDYGDSFSRSVDKFGIIAAVVRLEDKFNRLENLTTNGGKKNVKDESLADTAFDISGYGLLLYKYLKEHERTSK